LRGARRDGSDEAISRLTAVAMALAIRGAIGTRELDVLLAMKDAVAKDLLAA